MKAKTANVGIVIVSHSPLVARGTADMVRQMVGDGVRFHGAEAMLKAVSARMPRAFLRPSRPRGPITVLQYS